MGNYKLIEKKIWNAVSALTSGVLTSVIYDAISNTKYVLELEGERYVVTATGVSFWVTIGFIFATFLFFWTVISVAIPFILQVRKRFSYEKIGRVSSQGLVKILESSKKTITDLYPLFYNNGKDTFNEQMVNMYTRDIAGSIRLLHKSFLPHNQRMRRHIENYFRNPNHSSITTIDSNISTYEISTIICLLKEMVYNIEVVGCKDELLSKDCCEMEKMLSDLEVLVAEIKCKNNKSVD